MKTFCIAIISRTFYYLGVWRLLFWLCALVDKRPIVAVFAYHRVVTDPERPEFLQGYEKGMHVDQYERQIEVIGRYFDVISPDRFEAVVTGREVPATSRPLALLTYDDGDSENWTHAFPILLRKRYPALVFIPTGFIDSTKRFYHLRLTNILNNLNNGGWAEVAGSEMPSEVRAVFDRYDGQWELYKYQIRRQLMDPLHDMEPTKRDALLDRWESIINNKYTLGIHPMSWEQIKRLPESKIEIGSHTVNHNRLVLLSTEEVDYELRESKRQLEEIVKRPITTICYPEGSYNTETLHRAQAAGYRIGFTTKRELVEYPITGDALLKIGRIGGGLGSDHAIICPIGLMVLRRMLRGLHMFMTGTQQDSGSTIPPRQELPAQTHAAGQLRSTGT